MRQSDQAPILRQTPQRYPPAGAQLSLPFPSMARRRADSCRFCNSIHMSQEDSIRCRQANQGEQR